MTQSSRLARDIAALSRAQVLVVGDLMLDRFVAGAVDRISPEAPIPVFRVKGETPMPGGAANVAANVAALGGTATLVGVMGEDEAARALTALLREVPNLRCATATDRTRATTVKTRYVAQGQQLLRADRENAAPVSDEIAAALLHEIDAALPAAGAIVLSDYGKGVLSASLVRRIVDKARAAAIPVVVDPQGRDYARYAGAAYVSPNRAELALASGRPTESEAEIIAAAHALMEAAGLDRLLVTRSEDGMSLVSRTGEPVHLPAEAREVFDVSGAGDTVVAAFATGLASGLEPTQAARLANTAAGIVVTKAGTAVVSAHELLAHVHENDLKASDAKLRTVDEALRIAAGWRERGLRIGFTNGAFDLLHPGHIGSIAQAKAHCDRLVVALNSDESVRRLKGPGRPVQTETARALVLGALEQVDMIVIFSAETPLDIIRALRPDVLVKGADYRLDQVVGADIVQGYGGKVVLADFLDGHSTTRTIARMAG